MWTTLKAKGRQSKACSFMVSGTVRASTIHLLGTLQDPLQRHENHALPGMLVSAGWLVGAPVRLAGPNGVLIRETFAGL